MFIEIDPEEVENMLFSEDDLNYIDRDRRKNTFISIRQANRASMKWEENKRNLLFKILTNETITNC